MWVTARSEAEAQKPHMIGTSFAGVGLCITCLKLVIQEFVGRLTPCESLVNERLVRLDYGPADRRPSIENLLQRQVLALKVIAGRSG